jgi:hypothetical protein
LRPGAATLSLMELKTMMITSSLTLLKLETQSLRSYLSRSLAPHCLSGMYGPPRDQSFTSTEPSS